MPKDELTVALKQVEDIRRFCDFCERLPMPPVTMPQDPVRAAGLDPDAWHGLGIVGLWAAIDAFVERRAPLGSGGPLPQRVGVTNPPPWLATAMDELEDMRHLYAHNFAGVADAAYFAQKRLAQRRVFKPSQQRALSSGTGTLFDGVRLVLSLGDLRHYTQAADAMLMHLNAAWP